MKFREHGFVDPDDYMFNFGKHKGQYYAHVRDIDPQYIQWCDDNLNWFNLTMEERDYIDELVDDEFERYGIFGPEDIY